MVEPLLNANVKNTSDDNTVRTSGQRNVPHYNNGTPISALSLRAHCTSILTSAARGQHILKVLVLYRECKRGSA